MKVPAQRPHRSEQTVCTPADFLAAVSTRFGEIGVDLACTTENSVSNDGYYYDAVSNDGYYFDLGFDALAHNWTAFINNSVAWLNPPFGKCAAFAEKAARTELRPGAKILMLVPASVGSNWFREWVHRRAYVLALSPRLTFKGHAHPYPKDLILAVYSAEGAVGFDCWNWKTKG